jgi:hypothetical protein
VNFKYSILVSGEAVSGLDYSSHGINLLQVGNITRVTLPLSIALPLSLAQQSGSELHVQGLQAISIDVDIGNMKAHKWMASTRINKLDRYK